MTLFIMKCITERCDQWDLRWRNNKGIYGIVWMSRRTSSAKISDQNPPSESMKGEVKSTLLHRHHHAAQVCVFPRFYYRHRSGSFINHPMLWWAPGYPGKSQGSQFWYWKFWPYELIRGLGWWRLYLVMYPELIVVNFRIFTLGLGKLRSQSNR